MAPPSAVAWQALSLRACVSAARCSVFLSLLALLRVSECIESRLHWCQCRCTSRCLCTCSQATSLNLSLQWVQHAVRSVHFQRISVRRVIRVGGQEAVRNHCTGESRYRHRGSRVRGAADRSARPIEGVTFVLVGSRLLFACGHAATAVASSGNSHSGRCERLNTV